MLAVNVVCSVAVLILVVFLLLRKHGDSGAAKHIDDAFAVSRRENAENQQMQRQELNSLFASQTELNRNFFSDFTRFLQDMRESTTRNDIAAAEKTAKNLQDFADRNDRRFGELVQSLEEKINSLKNAVLEENRNFRREQIEFQSKFQSSMNQQLEQNRNAVDLRLKEIQAESAAKLDEMKKTVDDKLQESMEKHFNESFKLISERLEQVHKGLGEMQNLAAGVGDLKKVLTNVKTRGNLGEIQLLAILEQYLAPEQYVANVITVPGSRELVEFAIKMPGKKDEEPVLLPLDSKFPVEDYQRLQEAYEIYPRMSAELKKSQEAFVKAIKKSAADIQKKYIYPPVTTAFAMMFVPSEGIYAEILRQPGLFEQLQNEFKTVVLGPSNLVAFLNALQMGFKTLALEKRSNEVWRILGAVKTEFHKFGDAMEATRKSLQTVVNHVDKIGVRSRALERQLRDVQELPSAETASVLPEPAACGEIFTEPETDGQD